MRYGTLARLDVAQSRVSWRRKAAFAIFSLLSRRDSRKIVRRRRCLVLVLYSHALFDSCPRFWTQSNNDSLWRTADLTALCFYVLSSGVKGDMRVFGPRVCIATRSLMIFRVRVAGQHIARPDSSRAITGRSRVGFSDRSRHPGTKRSKEPLTVRQAKTFFVISCQLLMQARKIGDYLLHLIVHQEGIWHSFRIIQPSMCGGHEMTEPLGIEILALNNGCK